jgi:hypothetical protein
MQVGPFRPDDNIPIARGANPSLLLVAYYKGKESERETDQPSLLPYRRAPINNTLLLPPSKTGEAMDPYKVLPLIDFVRKDLRFLLIHVPI